MKNFYQCLFLVLVLTFCDYVYAKKVEEPAVSTQGYGVVNEDVFVNSKPSKTDKNEQKVQKNRLKKQIRLQKKIDRYDLKRVQTQKEINYQERRLELKKQKLEALAPNSRKGESE